MKKRNEILTHREWAILKMVKLSASMLVVIMGLILIGNSFLTGSPTVKPWLMVVGAFIGIVGGLFLAEVWMTRYSEYKERKNEKMKKRK